MLLDGWPRGGALFNRAVASVRNPQRLEIGGDVERLDIGQFIDAVLFKPGEERADAR
jgi:hypothetical protein